MINGIYIGVNGWFVKNYNLAGVVEQR